MDGSGSLGDPMRDRRAAGREWTTEYTRLGSAGATVAVIRTASALLVLFAALPLSVLSVLAVRRAPSVDANAEALSTPQPMALKSVSGWLNVTLRVEMGMWRLPLGIQFRTRLYNGLAPGPILWAAPGEQVRILIQNRLEPNNASTTDAHQIGFRHANTTNLHLHGIYDDARHDDTFARVAPGEDRMYEYTLHAGSGSTLLYYHPHVDGATSLQSLGGMGGALVIADAKQEAAMDLPLATDRVLVLQALSFDPHSPDYILTQLANGGTSTLDPQLINPTGFDGWLMLVNGGSPVREQIPLGNWMRLRLVNAVVGGASALNLSFIGEGSIALDAADRKRPPSDAADPADASGCGGGGGSGGGGSSSAGSDVCATCRLMALAYDGVWLSAPRALSSLMLPPGGRADVAIACTRVGQCAFGSVGSVGYGGVLPGFLPAVHIDSIAPTAAAPTRAAPAAGAVDDGTASPKGAIRACGAVAPLSLPMRLPGAPAYYADLRELDAARVSSRQWINFSTPTGANSINGRVYDPSQYLEQLSLGSVVEWRLRSEEMPSGVLKLHPYHQHMTHFQIIRIEVDTTDVLEVTAALGVAVGDWRDTIPLYGAVKYTVRFIAPFEGLLTVHCHIQKHSEHGMMALVRVNRPIQIS